MITVLLPTLDRPEKLPALIREFQNVATVRTTVIAIAEHDDYNTINTLDSLNDPALIIVVGNYGSCARAVNAGFQHVQHPYFAVANDDSWPHPGWDTAALTAAETAPIVGLNDGHDRMTCFTLASTQWVQRHGGTFDDTGSVYHDGYQSQYCDTEFADYAKHRGAWTEAPAAILEHRHHDFGKADASHPNYQKARATCAADHARYTERRQRWESL